jgi:chromosomal replication initiation ATPase DnaA|tara:strand:- start:2094 stop:2402 length:309 start_codon:yes stop_codon:yes gene_type:complete
MNYKKTIFNQYADRVCIAHNISTKQLFTKDKTKHIADARHMLYYLCIERPMRIAYIETFMKESGYNITHSSIIYGFKKIQQNKLKDNDFKAIVKQIKECVTL